MALQVMANTTMPWSVKSTVSMMASNVPVSRIIESAVLTEFEGQRFPFEHPAELGRLSRERASQYRNKI